MLKAELIVDLQSKFTAVGTPQPQLEAPDEKGVMIYMVNVLESGLSGINKKPVAYQRNIHFYVYHEGLGDEAAFYQREEPINTSDTDVTPKDNSLLSYQRIYPNIEIRNRVLGFILLSITTIISEGGSVPDHANRLLWAIDAVKDPEKYLNFFMAIACTNATVRQYGNTVLDSAINTGLTPFILRAVTAFKLV